ncbi:hypothetical protein EMCRGX_G027955 [Ephydatia muelleri]
MPFYTSKYGYKVGLAAKVDTRYEQDHDTLCDVQGGYDTLLAWPVRFTVKLTQTAPRGSKQASILSSINVFKMIPNNSEVPETYQFPMLVSLDQMSEFAVNDSFYFKCITTVHQEVDRFAAQSSLSWVSRDPDDCFSPLEANAWEIVLRGRMFVGLLVEGVKMGFRIGFDRSSPLVTVDKNMPSTAEHDNIVSDYVESELRK